MHISNYDSAKNLTQHKYDVNKIVLFYVIFNALCVLVCVGNYIGFRLPTFTYRTPQFFYMIPFKELHCLYWSTRLTHRHGRSYHCFLHILSVRTYFSKSNKRKQVSSENNVHYFRDIGSVRVDHWWHLSSTISLYSFFKNQVLE